MRYADEVVDTKCGIWGAPAAESFKSRGPRSKSKRQGIGKALRLVVVVLMIVIPLAFWLSSVVVASPASTALSHY
jgi:hypothetical protein